MVAAQLFIPVLKVWKSAKKLLPAIKTRAQVSFSRRKNFSKHTSRRRCGYLKSNLFARQVRIYRNFGGCEGTGARAFSPEAPSGVFFRIRIESSTSFLLNYMTTLEFKTDYPNMFMTKVILRSLVGRWVAGPDSSGPLRGEDPMCRHPLSLRPSPLNFSSLKFIRRLLLFRITPKRICRSLIAFS